ncbi:MAG: hypothetical protein JHD28_07890 [Bacteroidia bacterium]|nr:hypothetical protein [Bacteroidia bacterium]
MYKKLLLIVVTLFFTNLIFAQTNNNADSLIEATITLKDGSILRGTIIAINLEEVSLKTQYAGVIVIKQKNIANISNVKNEAKTKVQIPNGNSGYENVNPRNYQSKYQLQKKPIIVSHKYWWNNNYQGLKQNEFYYQNIGILYNGLDFGVVDNFSIGGGAFFLGIVGFFNIHVRTQFKITNGISIGASYNHFMAGAGSSSRSSDNNSVGLLSGGFTLGDTEKNLTISAGKFTNLVNSNSTSGQSDLAVIICGNLKLSNNLYLITDNYFADRRSNFNLNCLGFRSTNNTTAFDYGLMSLGNNSYRYNNSPILIPYLALSVKIQ